MLLLLQLLSVNARCSCSKPEVLGQVELEDGGVRASSISQSSHHMFRFVFVPYTQVEVCMLLNPLELTWYLLYLLEEH